MARRQIALLCALILLSAASFAHEGEEGPEIFEEPVFMLVFGLVGAGAYQQYIGWKKMEFNLLSAGAAFFGGYFFIQYFLALLI